MPRSPRSIGRSTDTVSWVDHLDPVRVEVDRELIDALRVERLPTPAEPARLTFRDAVPPPDRRRVTLRTSKPPDTNSNQQNDSERSGGPKEKIETWQTTHLVCPLCDEAMVGHDSIPMPDGTQTLAPVDFHDGDITDAAYVCAERDADRTTWLYFHGPGPDLSKSDDPHVRAREKQRTTRQIIRELQSEYDDEPGAPERKVIERARETGLDEANVESQLQKLRDKAKSTRRARSICGSSNSHTIDTRPTI